MGTNGPSASGDVEEVARNDCPQGEETSEENQQKADILKVCVCYWGTYYVVHSTTVYKIHVTVYTVLVCTGSYKL